MWIWYTLSTSLQDIIEDVTEDSMEPTRKKRWTVGGTWDTVGGGGGGGSWDTEPDIFTFINEGGPDHLYNTLPHILKPLMVCVVVELLVSHNLYPGTQRGCQNPLCIAYNTLLYLVNSYRIKERESLTYGPTLVT